MSHTCNLDISACAGLFVIEPYVNILHQGN